jgi:type II secretory pathway pseudopilin PulG
MKTLKGRTKGGGARLPGVRGEGGFLLVLVMVVLLVVSTIAGATLINSFLEKSLAKNQNYASIALQAADGGIAAAITWLRENQAGLYNPAKDADFYTNASKHGWTQQLTRTLPSGGAYTVTMRFKRQWFDYNEDGDCGDAGEQSEYRHDTAMTLGQSPATDCAQVYSYTDPAGVTHNVHASAVVVLYNNCASTAVGCFGFPDAKFLLANEGYPVVEIDSVGTFGQGSYREIALDIARDKYVVPGVKGAITSKNGVGFGASASQVKDGRPHALNGLLCDGSQGAPVPPCEDTTTKDGLFVENNIDADGDGIMEGTCPGCEPATGLGNAGTTFPVSTVSVNPIADPPLCASAECVLGYGSRADLEADSEAVIWDRTTYAGTDNQFYASVAASMTGGKLVIVKHPPGEVITAGVVTTPGKYIMPANTQITYDPNPALNRTCRLVVDGIYDAGGNTEFTGLIVAQGFEACGNLTVTGATVCVGGLNVPTAYANGGVKVVYSGDALAQSTGKVGYATRLGWHRLR